MPKDGREDRSKSADIFSNMGGNWASKCVCACVCVALIVCCSVMKNVYSELWISSLEAIYASQSFPNNVHCLVISTSSKIKKDFPYCLTAPDTGSLRFIRHLTDNCLDCTIPPKTRKIAPLPACWTLWLIFTLITWYVNSSDVFNLVANWLMFTSDVSCESNKTN